MRLVIDTETNGLVNPDKIWCVVIKDVDSDNGWSITTPTGEFSFEDTRNLKDIVDRADLIIGHNFLSYDLDVIKNLCGVTIPWTKVYDTLVVSRLINYNNFQLKGRHSLEAWGEYFKEPKIKFNKFDEYSDEMLEYCIQDCKVNKKLFLYLDRWTSKEEWRYPVELEHYTAMVCDQMKKDGFRFDIEKNNALLKSVEDELYTLKEVIRDTIRLPDVLKASFNLSLRKNISKKLLKFLEDNGPTIDLSSPESIALLLKRERDLLINEGYTHATLGEKYDIYEKVEFNPGSSKQRVEVLWSYGWKPFSKTDGHMKYLRGNKRTEEEDKKWEFYGWKTDEDNLSTLPKDCPEGAKVLSQWLVLESRRMKLQEWKDCYNEGTHRLHPTINGIGTWTHRKSHANPNAANIFSVYHGDTDTPIGAIKNKYDAEIRSCWVATPGNVLVGTDADSIQLRVLADYLENPVFTKACEEGRKEDGTDVHSMNLKALELPHLNRDNAKTFIYAWVLNASIPKVANILSTSIPQAQVAVEKFIRRTDGILELKSKKIPYDAARGFFDGFDGRKVLCSSEHHMLAGYLQCGEATIMKVANRIWRQRLNKEKIWYRQVNDVHDEWQTEAFPDEAEYIGKVQCEAIAQAGLELGLKTKFAGSYDIGLNWTETH